MQKRRIVVKAFVILFSLMILIGAVSCQKQSPAPPREVESQGETDIVYSDDLPSDLNFAGQEVDILWWRQEEFSNEYSANIVDGALYERDRQVESRLNILINNTYMAYTWDTRENYVTNVTTPLLAGSKDYDIITGHYPIMPRLMNEGILYDLNQVKYLDIEKPYWSQDLADMVEIKDKMFFATGDITKTYTVYAYSYFMNKTLLNRYEGKNADQVVQDVLDGKWTHEYLLTMLEDTYVDDGNDVRDEGDTFGLIINASPEYIPHFFGFDTLFSEKNGDEIKLTCYGEHFLNVYNTIDALVNSNRNVIQWQDNYQVTLYEVEAKEMFFSGQSVFFCNEMVRAEYFKDMTDSWTCLPMPKYNEEQANYHTRVGEAATVVSIAYNVDNIDLMGATLEAMASTSYDVVTPALYEITYKIRYGEDQITGKLFDLVRNGVKWDFSVMYTSHLPIQNEIRFCMYRQGSWATKWGELETSMNNELESLIYQFETMG